MFIDHVSSFNTLFLNASIPIPSFQFLGDIGQPLHVEALEVGGNDIDAICGGKKTNLHAVRSSPIVYCGFVER